MAAGTAVPERIRWAVETLAASPANRLLEVGCGGGVAVTLICPLLATGRILAIDRSATMTARAEARNAEHIRTGRAAVVTAAFSAADLAAAGLDGERFDKVFAINVNLFWTGPARDELSLVRSLLAPGGVLYLFYEPPARRTEEIVGKVTGALEVGGFATEVITAASRVAIVGRADRAR